MSRFCRAGHSTSRRLIEGGTFGLFFLGHQISMCQTTVANSNSCESSFPVTGLFTLGRFAQIGPLKLRLG